MLGFSHFARHGFDFRDIFGMGLAITLAVGANAGEVGFDVLTYS
ncbi:hypothetical protein UT5_21270 [Ferrigenium sp. UT5]